MSSRDRQRKHPAFAAFTVFTLLPSAAQAAPIAGITPWSQTSRVGFETDGVVNVVPGASGFSAVLEGQHELVRGLFLGGRFGFATVQLPDDAPLELHQDRTFGNPIVSLRFARTVLPGRLAVHVGGRVGFPLVPSGEAAPYAARFEGLWGGDTFAGSLTVRPGVGIEVAGARGPAALIGRADLHALIVVPLQGSTGRILFELAMEGEWRHTTGVAAGLRLQGVFLPGPIVAIEPFVAFTPEWLPFYARVGSLILLTGTPAEGGPPTAFRLSFGWKAAGR